MSEQLDLTWTYGILPLAMFQMLTRLDHLTDRALHLGYHDFAVTELRERGGVFRALSHRSADDIVPAKGRLFSQSSQLRETHLWEQSRWDASRHCELVMELTAAPVTISGTGLLTGVRTTSTEYKVSLSIEATARFGGRRIEREITEALEQALQAEHKFRLLWLDRRSPYSL